MPGANCYSDTLRSPTSISSLCLGRYQSVQIESLLVYLTGSAQSGRCLSKRLGLLSDTHLNPSSLRICTRPDASPPTINCPSGEMQQLKNAASPAKLNSKAPFSIFHTRNVRSRDPETIHRPSGLTATAKTASVCPSRVRSGSPVSKSHNRSVWSQDPETAHCPSSVTATA